MQGIKRLRYLVRAEVHLVAGDDVIARLDTCDTLSHTLHNACGLMAQYAGEEALRVCKRRVHQPQDRDICMFVSMTAATSSSSLRRDLCSWSCSIAPKTFERSRQHQCRASDMQSLQWHLGLLQCRDNSNSA